MPRRRTPPDRPAQFTAESVNYWDRAEPGQWFIGVIDTNLNQASIVPVNVFETSGRLDEDVINNRSSRGMNRYASGAPGEKESVSNSIAPDFMKNRPPGMTHHVAVVEHEGFDIESSLGFSLIKYTPNFAQFKGTSSSLNGSWPEAKIGHSFSRETHMQTLKMLPSSPDGPLGRAGDKVPPRGAYPTSMQMPELWKDHTVASLKMPGARPFIEHIAVSLD